MFRIDVKQWLHALESQRRALRMTLPAVAERAHVSRATVRRVLKEKRSSARLDNVLAIAAVLGAEFEFRLAEPEAMIEAEVQKRARKVAEMVQGTMALESQGLTDEARLAEIAAAAATELRSKPRKHLWLSQCRPSQQSPAKRRSRTSPS